jgi:hypothetical protein
VFEKSNAKTLVIAAVLILTIVLSLAPSTVYQVAKTQGIPFGTKRVQASSLSGSINCPTGTQNAGQVFPASLDFLAQISRGTIIGSFVVNSPNTAGQKNGEFTFGHISANTFTLTGIESDFLCTGGLSTISTSVTLTGQCSGGTVTLKTANGETGTFSGSIACA